MTTVTTLSTSSMNGSKRRPMPPATAHSTRGVCLHPNSGRLDHFGPAVSR